MKNFLTWNKTLVACISAVGYGVGYKLPEAFGYDLLICGVLSTILGISMDYFAKWLVYSKTIQSRQTKKFLIFMILLFFFSCDYICEEIIGIDLWDDLIGQLIYIAGVAVLAVITSTITKKFAIWKIRRINTNIDEGIKMNTDKIKSHADELYGENKPISGKYKKSLAVKCHNGIFVGIKKNKVLSFRGIPYATQQRWKAPQPMPSSNLAFEAYYFGPPGIQFPDERNTLSHMKQSEDCLTINIWKNTSFNDKKGALLRPVLVYIPFTEGTIGGSSLPICHGANFVKNNPEILAVSFNYRFGLMGFMDFSNIPGGEEYADSSRIGLLDVITALKWLKTNIAAFGGDPDNITIAGDIGSALIALALPLCPEAKGLFKRIIANSPYWDLEHYVTVECAKHCTELIRSEYNLTSMDDFLSLTTEDFQHILRKYSNSVPIIILDRKYLPHDIFKAYEQGAAAGIDIIIGCSKDDAKVCLADMGKDFFNEITTNKYDQWLTTGKKDVIAALEQQLIKLRRNGMDAEEAIICLFNYVMFYTGQFLLCKSHIKAGGKAYCYYGNCGTSLEAIGANCFSMLTLLMGNLTAAHHYGVVIQPRMSTIYQKIIANFITSGTPQLNTWDIPDEEEILWPQFTDENPYIMEITDTHFEAHISDIMDDCQVFEEILHYD